MYKEEGHKTFRARNQGFERIRKPGGSDFISQIKLEEQSRVMLTQEKSSGVQTMVIVIKITGEMGMKATGCVENAGHGTHHTYRHFQKTVYVLEWNSQKRQCLKFPVTPIPFPSGIDVTHLPIFPLSIQPYMSFHPAINFHVWMYSSFCIYLTEKKKLK